MLWEETDKGGSYTPPGLPYNSEPLAFIRLRYAKRLVKIQIHLSKIFYDFIVQWWAFSPLLWVFSLSLTFNFLVTHHWTLLSNFDFLHPPQILHCLKYAVMGPWPTTHCRPLAHSWHIGGPSGTNSKKNNQLR